jgi:hypothetical protein
MDQKISLFAGSLVVVCAMTVAGVVINSSAVGIDQAAAVAQIRPTTPRKLPNTNASPAALKAGDSDGENVVIPRKMFLAMQELKRICSNLAEVKPAPTAAVKEKLPVVAEPAPADTTVTEATL